MKYAPHFVVPAIAILAACANLGGRSGAAGIDVSNFDAQVRPQDDFYRHINGRWIERTAIPADLSNYGSFSMLTVQAEERVRTLLEQAVAKREQANPVARKAAALYASFMNEALIEQQDLAPLADELKKIEAIRDHADVLAYLGYSQTIGADGPLRWYLQPDPRDSKNYLAGVAQGGLSLPDRDYYLRDETAYVGYRQKLKGYVAELLQQASGATSEAGTAAEMVVAIEKRLAQIQWTRVQNRDPVAGYNKLDNAALTKLAPGLNWQLFLVAVGAPTTVVNIDQPSYIEDFDALLREISVADWKIYLRYHLLDDAAPYLPKRFEQPHFEFHDKTLSGVQQQRERWKRAVQLVDGAAGELTGQMYVEAWFSVEQKRRMQKLVANLLKAYSASIDTLEWMSAATRVEAHRKLAAINIKIGYPDSWRDYSALRLEANDLLGNVMRASQFEHQRQLARIGNPVVRTEWHMTPPTVNAYYSQSLNEIVFPAAILQPPFFDASADDAVNYGAIGAVIGHEISHGFDDAGRQFDASGNLRDWWTAEDAASYKERAQQVVRQFGSYRVLDNQPINGELTLGENIADIAGLAIAYKAYQLSRPTAVGLESAQGFFAGWAQIWRRKYRDDNLRLRLSTDSHSPSEFRTNGTVVQMEAFYSAFGVKPGDKMYLKPEDRIRIW